MNRFIIHPLTAFTLVALALIFFKGNVYAESVRIEIKEEGVYQISYIDLKKIGVPVDTINPKTIRIYNNKDEIPIAVDGEEDGRFDSSDDIEFYALGIPRDSEYYEFTDTDVYWLEWGGNNGKRFIAPYHDDTPGNLPPPTSFLTNIHLEKDLIWWWSKPESEEKDHWFWEKISVGINDGIVSKPFDIRNIDRGSSGCSVKLSVHGITDPLISPDHHTQIYLNDIFLNEYKWDGSEWKIWDILNIPCSYLKEGGNILKIESVGIPITDQDLKEELGGDDGILDIDSIYLDWFEIGYRKTYSAENYFLRFTGTGDGPVDFAISNLYPDPGLNTILDITDYPFNATKFTTLKLIDKRIYFRDVIEGYKEKKYVATVKGVIPYVKLERYERSSSLKNSSNSADYIIITHGDFFESALHLADYRKAQGLKTKVINVKDIYDEFSYGIFSPHAIRDFLKYAYTYWSLSPKYIVLFGDATYDYKDNYKLGEFSFIPTMLVPGESGLIPTDNWFVDIEGDILPEMMIGRLSVKSVKEADIVVNKNIDYEHSSGGDWNKNLLFVADNENDFEMLSDKLYESIPQEYHGNKVYMQTYYDLSSSNNSNARLMAREAVAAGINDGALITIYTGHGDVDQWADENMINSSQVLGTDGSSSVLKNYDRLSFIITLNCLNGAFPMPNEGGIKDINNPGFIPLAEAFLKLENGGAVSVWSPSSLGYTSEHDTIAERLFDSLFNKGITRIGESILQAKTLAYKDDGISKDIVNMYTLFGDPATRLSIGGNSSPENKGDEGSGGCFISTAAYGSYLHPHVKVLRNFRDLYLLTNPIGRIFVRLYYAWSPPLADIISKHESLRLITRIILTPFVYVLLYPWLSFSLLFTISFIILFYRIFNHLNLL